MGMYLSLGVHSVTCVDETGGWMAEKVGNDEMWLCGLAIDNANNVEAVLPMNVYNNFDDGDVKRYSTPAIFHQFYFDNTITATQNFAVVFFFAEKDSSGTQQLRQFINNAVTTTRKNIREFGVPIVPGSEEQLSKWSEICLSVSSLFQRLAGAINDDVFPPVLRTVMVTNGVCSSLWPEQLEVRGHDGRYAMEYGWQLGY